MNHFKMKNIYSQIAASVLILALAYTPNIFSQVKIGDNPRSINADAMLEIESTNKGVLLPRIALKSTTSAAPLKKLIAGMVVYNTSNTNDITPGLYYSDGTKWIRAVTNINESESTSNQLWSLKGNKGITTNNFLGSTNNAPLIIKTNNLERLRDTEKGWVGIGTSTPKSALQTKGQLIIDSISLGNRETDKILVANPNDGKVKYVPASSLINNVQNYCEMVSNNGQTIFKTPATITDINKIFLYRNGVLISFTVNNNNSILAELPCKQGDQIRIIQLL